jgi:hypothetical protein
MSRITLEDTTISAMTKMSEGNPGAMAAIMDLYNETPQIDPQCFAGGLGPILSLDTLGIYGTDIYVLWNDQCNRDTRRMVMILRAWQLGFIDGERLTRLAGDQMRTEIISEEEWKEINDKVVGQLESFATS